MTLQQHFDSGVSHHQAGQLAHAEKIYREVLAQDPNHSDALCLLGTLAGQVGKNDAGIDLLRRAISISPGKAFYYSNLGKLLQSTGRLGDAIAAYRQAIALKPDFVEALNNLANALVVVGRYDDAVIASREAIRVQPGLGTAHGNLGSALAKLGRNAEAIAAFENALRLNPADAEVLSNMGTVYGEIGNFDSAIAAFRRATELRPDFAAAYSNLGNSLTRLGRIDEAIAACTIAITLKPDFAEAHYNLGVALQWNRRIDDTVAAYRNAIALSPHLAKAHNNLGSALTTLGEITTAVAAHRQAIRINPDYAEAHSNLLFALNYQTPVDVETNLAEHRAWAEILLQNVPVPDSYSNITDPDRPLRIGYVSADFRRHSVGYFFLPIIENHDRNTVSAFCYSNVRYPDDITARMKRSAREWRDISHLSDPAAADLIRDDAIDVLVDLCGHTSGNRLRLFGRKPAPVQISYLGYPNTTGIAAIDYRLTDAYADPPGLSENLYVEKLWRLPACAWCFDPTEDLAPRTARVPGPITFGCFNALAKINRPLVEIWSQLLRQTPDSRLTLKSTGTGQASVRHRISHWFSEFGIPSDRLELLGWVDQPADHLESYHRIDIALDTWPYHGTATTCQALWMGVPVVTLAGSTHISRVGVSLLNAAGLPDLIAHTPDQYIDLAAELAANPPQLNSLSSTLRRQLKTSSLMNGPQFARNLESAYRQMWTHWCLE